MEILIAAAAVTFVLAVIEVFVDLRVWKIVAAPVLSLGALFILAGTSVPILLVSSLASAFFALLMDLIVQRLSEPRLAQTRRLPNRIPPL
jgi:hypothetical protein